MNRQAKLWEVLSGFVPVVIGLVVWIWNLSTTVDRSKYQIQQVEIQQSQFKEELKEISKQREADKKEILDKLETIIIKLENKQDR